MRVAAIRMGAAVATNALLASRRTHAPQGLAGGGPGLAGRQSLLMAHGAVRELPGCFSLEVQPGDATEIETPGSGGFGSAAGALEAKP